MSAIPDAAMQAALETANVGRDADGLWPENATILMQAALAAAFSVMLREVASRYEASQNIEVLYRQEALICRQRALPISPVFCSAWPGTTIRSQPAAFNPINLFSNLSYWTSLYLGRQITYMLTV